MSIENSEISIAGRLAKVPRRQNSKAKKWKEAREAAKAGPAPKKRVQKPETLDIKIEPSFAEPVVEPVQEEVVEPVVEPVQEEVVEPVVEPVQEEVVGEKIHIDAELNTESTYSPAPEVFPEAPTISFDISDEVDIQEDLVVQEEVVELVEEPIVEEPIVEEPIVEEPIVEEPIVEEPVQEDQYFNEELTEEDETLTVKDYVRSMLQKES